MGGFAQFGTVVMAATAACSSVRVATGFASHVLCSATFVSGLDPDRVYAETVRPTPHYGLVSWGVRYEIDRKARRVRTTMLGGSESVATYRDGVGCVLLHGNPPVEILAIESEVAALPLAGDAPTEPINEQLRDALARDFEETDGPLRRTKAIVVLYDGRIVGERYAEGYGIGNQLPGWSVAKAVTNALVGILVRQGKLRLDQPAPIAEWNGPGDARGSITIEHLLRMESGLDEANADPILFLERDMAAASARRPLVHPPGTAWHYTDADYLLLSRIVRDAAGGRPEDLLRFAGKELFGPLGMGRVTLEFDGAGTPLGSGFMYAAPRDWARFGLLYANDGMTSGTRILPAGWVGQSSSQTLGSPYAAGFWRGSAEWRARHHLPEDAFFASGAFGQRIFVIPSEKLVIVHFSVTQDWPDFAVERLGRFVADVRAALHDGARPSP